MMHMTKRKHRANEEKEVSAKTGRIGKQMNFWLDDDVVAAMQAFFGSVEFAPNQTAFFDRAAKEFLAKRGFWPLGRNRGNIHGGENIQ